MNMSSGISASQPTPMMAQYLDIKSQVGEDILLFYRMGDFYELFFEDAVQAAAALDIALTKRGKHKGADIPMCGVPAHAAENYLQQLIKKGFRVAVCDQTENPQAAKQRGTKAVVRREVVRLVTPGTLTEDSLLDARGQNYILSLAGNKLGDYALAWADISDGTFALCDVSANQLASEIATLNGRELLLAESLYQNNALIKNLPLETVALTPLAESKFDHRSATERIKARFEVTHVDGFGDFSKLALSAAGALIDYLELTQAGAAIQLSPPQIRPTNAFMSIDPATRASLEIDRNQKGERKGTLLSVLDRTITSAGGRYLAECLAKPLLSVEYINARLDVVDFFVRADSVRQELRDLLKGYHDMARAISRIALGRGGPRDMRNIGLGLQLGEQINAYFSQNRKYDLTTNLETILATLNLTDKPELAALMADIRKAFKAELPLLAREGGFIAQGWQADLDHLQKLRNDSRHIISRLQHEYAQKSGIQSLKIKQNNVLGYFIEITPKHADKLFNTGSESEFIHRQTLVSGVRFTTPTLAELDQKISGAGDKAVAIELEIFAKFTHRIQTHAELLRTYARTFAELDMYAALGQWAIEQNACRPHIDDTTTFIIKGGWHPVVSDALQNQNQTTFTENDCQLDGDCREAPRLTLITGPNMAGKSTFLRQNALMFILAQTGCFVPAREAHIGIAHSLFSRVGASDDLSRGRSTFMVEMIETAAILNQANKKSFVILDEIGRGTATFDGLSIAWATIEYLYTVNKSRTLFATHYHELTHLIENLEGASNASLRAKEWEGELVFLHDLRPGAADKSYGVQVAQLAGLPKEAIHRARTVLERLEDNHKTRDERLHSLPLFTAQTPTTERKPSEIDITLTQLDIDSLSPRQAQDLLYELQNKLKSKMP